MINRCIRLFETIFHEQVQIVPLIEDLALDVRIQLSKLANLPVLLCNKLLAHGGYLDVHVVFGQIEVRAKKLRRLTVCVPFDGERLRLVSPLDLVEIEESRELPFAVVGEFGGFRPGGREEVVRRQVPVAFAVVTARAVSGML